MRMIKNNNFLTHIKKILVIFLVFIIPLIFAGRPNKQVIVKTVSSNQIPTANAAGETSVAYMGDARPSKFKAAGISELTKDFNQVVAQSPTGKVGAVFLIGDFDKISQTQTAYNNSTLKTAGIPIFYVMGNHEVDDDNPDLLRQFFPYSSSGITLTPGPTGTESTTYSADIGNMHIVNLNVYWDGGTGSSSYTQRDGDVVTALRNWLSTNLAASPSACKVVLAHEPLYPKNRHTGDSLNKYESNRDALQALFVAQKVGVFVGAHTHYAVVNDYGGVWHSDAGVSGQKTEDGEDPFASIFYTHVNSAGQMILTWKKGSGSSWSTGGTYTAKCGGGGPDTEAPTVAITCPPDGKTYGSPLTSISGTAADNVAVSKVEVKVGPSGVWQLAATTDSWATWVVSNLTGVVAGANTIYARATDTSGNTSGDNAVFIRVNYDPTAVIKPALGNFQVKSLSTQNKPEILFDTYTDIGSINSYGATRKATSPGEQAILQSYVAPTSFNWNPSFISNRFSIARSNASKSDYLVFLMEEEMVQPNYGWYYGVRPGFPGDGAVHTVDSVTGAQANWGASSETFILQLLTAWKQLCTNLGKKCAILADATGNTDPSIFFPDAFGSAGVNYIAANYDMIYAYTYPTSAANASCAGGYNCGKVKVDYWKKTKGFTGKINYILALEAPMNAAGYAIVKEDFKAAADAGADIISTYPNWTMSDLNDTQATARMIQIWNEYGGSSAAPVCTAGPGPGPCTPSCPGGCADVGQSDGCSGTCPNSQGNTCSDNNSCTLGDICSGGSCQPGVSKTCIPPNSCVSASCNSSGDCEFTNLTGPCDDSDGCTLNDTCSGGLCRGTPKDCSDSEACTIDFCTEGTCKNTDVCGGLVPCGRLVDNPDTVEIDEKAPCNLCTTIYLIKELINFAVKLAFALAILSLVIAGFYYTTSLGEKQKIEKAKNTMRYTIVGLAIVFFAWLAIAIILQAMGYASLDTWNQVHCTIAKDIPVPTPNPTVTPNPTNSPNPTPGPGPGPGPTPGPLPVSCTHRVYNQGNQVIGKNIATGATVSGTLNQVLSGSGNGIGKSGNHICIQNGNYSLREISDMQSNVIMECEYTDTAHKAVITATNSDFYLIHIKSDSVIKNCTFDHKGKTKTIFAEGEIKNWRVENNYFISSNISVIVENLTKSSNPTSGYGFIVNNMGLHSKLATFEGTTNLTVTGNYFTDSNENEYTDFNYNVHKVLFENNTFINHAGYSNAQEVIDMIGGNSFLTDYNIVRNNTIIGNFQTAIRPSKSAKHNTIENNHIEYLPGKVANIAGIYMYAGSAGFGSPSENTIINNTIIGTPIGIELAGANNNLVQGNNISNAIKGITLVKDSIHYDSNSKTTRRYGISLAATNNNILNNTIDNIDYGIYSQLSPSNTISGNIITNFEIKAIYP